MSTRLYKRAALLKALSHRFRLAAAATVVVVGASAAVIAENREDGNDEDDPPKAILIYKIKATTSHILCPPNYSLHLYTMLPRRRTSQPKGNKFLAFPHSFDVLFISR